jgi:hypothetical protein
MNRPTVSGCLAERSESRENPLLEIVTVVKSAAGWWLFHNGVRLGCSGYFVCSTLRAGAVSIGLIAGCKVDGSTLRDGAAFGSVGRAVGLDWTVVGVGCFGLDGASSFLSGWLRLASETS